MKVVINNKERETEFKDGEHYIDNILFDGHSILWAFEYKPKTYLKESELSGDEWRKGGEMIIYRNGVSVFREFCRTSERAFVVMQYILSQFKDFNWDAVEVGRRIYNHDVPSIVIDILEDGEITVKTEDGSVVPWAFKQEQKKEDGKYYEDEWKDKDRVHILSEHIHWYRK